MKRTFCTISLRLQVCKGLRIFSKPKCRLACTTLYRVRHKFIYIWDFFFFYLLGNCKKIVRSNFTQTSSNICKLFMDNSIDRSFLSLEIEKSGENVQQKNAVWALTLWKIAIDDFSISKLGKCFCLKFFLKKEKKWCLLPAIFQHMIFSQSRDRIFFKKRRKTPPF